MFTSGAQFFHSTRMTWKELGTSVHAEKRILLRILFYSLNL